MMFQTTVNPLRATRVSVSARRTANSRLRVVAKSSGGDGGKLSKEEAARKALQDALKGVNNNKDILANFDSKPPAGGSGGSGGGPNIKKIVGDFGDEFGRRAMGFFKAIGAILVFAGVLLLFQFWRPAVQLLQLAVVKLFRLDAPSARNAIAARAQAQAVAPESGKNVLGASEASVMSKYGGDEEDAEEEGKGGDAGEAQ